MAKFNADNERVKHDYFTYLRAAKRRNEQSVDAVAKAIARFEESNQHRAFKAFHRHQAKAFSDRLSQQVNARTGERLSRATVHSTLSALSAFIVWLADQPGYKSRITYADADYFNLSAKEVRIAKAVREKPVPTLEQIHHVISLMPSGTDIEKRDRALVAFTILTGARDGATISFRLKHLDLESGRLDQDAAEVSTKFSKTFKTWFFPVEGDALAIVTDWVAHLRSLHWGDDDPLFPAPRMALGPNGGFFAAGLERKPWTTAARVRAVFREAFERASLPYFNPHSFRNAIAALGERACLTPEEFKAWSQNLGHEGVLTTFTSYGAVPSRRQAELITVIRNRSTAPAQETLETRLARIERLLAPVALGA
ncbi:MAG: site-specific tyrosine recombinase XerC [Caulobacteraceae bacterium]|nr:site-specific tyrosine recombinase XerC [Caulobacteraceae bacterium]